MTAQIGRGQKENMSSWSKLEEFPPPLVRCLAREKVVGKSIRALTDQEVALNSNGLTSLDVKEISKEVSWDSVPTGMARKFFIGCNFDPLCSQDRNRAGAYMRSNPQFMFLQIHPHWKTTFLPLIRLFSNHAS